MKIDWDLTINNSAIQKIVQRVREIMYEAAYSAAVELMNGMEQDLRKIYHDTVSEFYADYSPVFYDRTESLYTLLELENTGSEMSWGFESNNATAFERGGGSAGLYEHVFRQGWHGGATGTDSRGYTARIPSWRTPYPYFTQWGNVAPQAPRSPLDAWTQEVEAYKTDVLPQRYGRLYRKHLQKHGLK